MAGKCAIHEVLDEYAGSYREAFRKNAAETYEDLVRRSGVDAEANKNTVRRIKALKKLLEETAGRLRFFRTVHFFCILLILAGFCVAGLFLYSLFAPEKGESSFRFPDVYWGISGFLAAVALLFFRSLVLKKRIDGLKAVAGEKQAELEEKLREAYAQMAPLNSLFRWDTVTDLVMKSCPIFTFDKFFSWSRMADLAENFHWDGASERPDSSVLFCHSGSINKSPFVLAETRDFSMGTKVYTGTLVISWREPVTYRDEKGNVRTRMETRTETLVATLEKPFPEYCRRKFLVYGNAAAPALSFSRSPSGLAGPGGGFFARMRLRSAVRTLLKMSNDMTTPFTILSNHEFDAVFSALDRSDEKAFRLLFTPLAQQEMLKILRDWKYGFGEKFSFLKRGMINVVFPDGALENFDFSASPALFFDYDLTSSEKKFNDYCNEFFRRIYFSFAPLLAIPLYQQEEGGAFREADPGLARYASPWECEALANDYDPALFRPPSCVTECILKTSRRDGEGPAALTVTSRGFCAKDRVTLVPVYGGDGKWHDVPVHWKEYLPVRKTTPLLLREAVEEEDSRGRGELFAGRKVSHVRFRRNIVSCILEDAGE
ncbi:MAG: hypothetical protein J6331_06230 [Lentisphaeria bacterium]|nr:hypothetical protein [Lentisphaeria bacterium]